MCTNLIGSQYFYSIVNCSLYVSHVLTCQHHTLWSKKVSSSAYIWKFGDIIQPTQILYIKK